MAPVGTKLPMRTVLGVGQSPHARGMAGPSHSLMQLRNPSPWQPREGARWVGKRKGARLPCGILGRNPSRSVEG